MVKTTFSLAELPAGSSGTIRDIDTTSPTSQRLMDLGFVPGTPIRAVQEAPLGDPTTFQIRGYQVGLRKTEADLINIDLTPDEN
jgi:ferrous iron transport protein A